MSGEPTDLCCRSLLPLRAFLPSISSPFLGLLIVRSAGWRWPKTRVVERRASNKVDCSFMAFCAEVLRADCSWWSLKLSIWHWNALTSSRRSAFGGLIGLRNSLNYKYKAFGLCNIQHYIIRISDDLLRDILWQILRFISSKASSMF